MGDRLRTVHQRLIKVPYSVRYDIVPRQLDILPMPWVKFTSLARSLLPHLYTTCTAIECTSLGTRPFAEESGSETTSALHEIKGRGREAKIYAPEMYSVHATLA